MRRTVTACLTSAPCLCSNVRDCWCCSVQWFNVTQLTLEEVIQNALSHGPFLQVRHYQIKIYRLIGMLLVSRFGLVEEDAVEVFHYYDFHLSSSFLMYNFKSISSRNGLFKEVNQSVQVTKNSKHHHQGQNASRTISFRQISKKAIEMVWAPAQNGRQTFANGDLPVDTRQ